MSSIVVDGERNASALPIDTSEWSYLAEGGFHIILCYEGSDPRLRRKILRIGKKSLGHDNAESNRAEIDHPSAPHESGTRKDFECGVLTPLLGSQYVQVGEAVELSRADMDNIHDRCASDVADSVCPMYPKFRATPLPIFMQKLCRD